MGYLQTFAMPILIKERRWLRKAHCFFPYAEGVRAGTALATSTGLSVIVKLRVSSHSVHQVHLAPSPSTQQLRFSFLGVA